ncbi:hypothetical protein WJX72_004028 [[Myrmecia] bisecta]|uniref:Legumain prodomain domain-containing protein n=1 Tax=[Myrmecia] bisecta TaxID=41462 RepID=A0AAW1PE41_9CHLO
MMKAACTFALVFLAGLAQSLRPTVLETLLHSAKPAKQDFTGDVWAVLIAGSSGWGNYRHQADVCHAYQILKQGGLNDDNIIVMMEDDIANNAMNPHPGKIFNRPGGPDVYKGVPLDYTGDMVTAENFLAVLAGNESALIGTSGKVVKSGPNDRVFVYYSDHGAPGIVGMPNGPFLYADALLNTMKAKSAANGFADMVLYIEACEAGSMFEGMLNDGDMNVYVTTAANAEESSWGTYCPGMVPAPPEEFNTCLGDLYSVAWMENSEAADLDEETLEKQYELVKLRTSNDYTYMQGSHVMQYGSLAIDEEPAADYLGEHNAGTGKKDPWEARTATANGAMAAVPQRDADLLHLWTAFNRAATSGEKARAMAALDAEISSRARIDKGVRTAVADLLMQPEVMATMQATFAAENLLLPHLGAQDAEDVLASEPLEMFVSRPLPLAAGKPLVDSWDCLRAMVGAWERACGKLDQYGMQYTRTFANLCNAGVAPELLHTSASKVLSDDVRWPTTL